MLKALIVEDEYLAREELIYLIATHSQIEVVATFDDGLEAFKYLQSNKVDVIFLDINIPSIDGMLLARNIHQFSEKPHIVFVTAYKEHAADAFELEAFDYLLKPFNEQRAIGVLQKLEQAQKHLSAADINVESLPVNTDKPKPKASSLNQTINLTQNNRIVVSYISDIYYAVANEKITEVYTREGVFHVPYTITDLMERLPSESFFRCHRSYCINIDKIREIIPWTNSTYLLKLRDIDGEVLVSRSNIKTFRALMNL
ncbi:LytTR family DNA-binding domain-containing protein [Shewanella sp. 3_MG-2023]|uniref:LytR/AlgR family response regulator transcription factor n=1 Tax=Shewanella sp. 3_MG-2023 TaxID=3062635 RepID=UPI0026E2EAB3|nr:LytTR family DNA-binding domain-containing protein [Shewanella sp. 3_MG-2023]MDO6777101.1 LytTR family DNA-binding domain-containing protein [Shewanella sp. 3_MG-2023]